MWKVQKFKVISDYIASLGQLGLYEILIHLKKKALNALSFLICSDILYKELIVNKNSN